MRKELASALQLKTSLCLGVDCELEGEENYALTTSLQKVCCGLLIEEAEVLSVLNGCGGVWVP
jgi:hypothetical protein